MKIGIYGGSFNPVHYGHLNVAHTAIDQLALDRLLVVPAAVNPFKAGRTETWTAPWDRLEGVRRAFGAIEKAVVDEREIRRGGVSYAIETVREIAAENPGAEFFFIIGEDSLTGLKQWKAYDELVRLCTFVAFPRTRESSTEIRELFKRGAVTLNPDAKVVALVKEGLERKGGYCPCRLLKTPEFFCPCREFLSELADPAYHGLCHCRLYVKQ